MKYFQTNPTEETVQCYIPGLCLLLSWQTGIHRLRRNFRNNSICPEILKGGNGGTFKGEIKHTTKKKKKTLNGHFTELRVTNTKSRQHKKKFFKCYNEK